MKKFALICMSLVLILSLAACQNSSQESSSETPQPSETVSEPAVDPKTLPENHSVEAIKERGELIIAFPENTHSIYTVPENNEYHGYNAEFVKLVANEIGVKATFVKKSSIAETLDAMGNGDADIAVSNFSRTPERLERFSVSDNYSFMESTKDPIYVLSENSQKFSTKESLSKAKIAVVADASQTEKAKKNFPEATYLEFSNCNECWEALKSGNADVIIAPTDATANKGFNKAWNNKTVIESAYDLEDTDNGRGYMMMKGNSSLTSKVNELIKKCLDDGSYKKWYSTYEKEAEKLGY